MRIRVAHLYPEYLNIYADRGNIAVLESRARWRGVMLEVERRQRRRRASAGRARSALHRGRPGSRAGADRAGPRGARRRDRRGDRRRRGRPGGVRRIPAARALLPRPRRRGASGRGRFPARDGRRREADDRRLPSRSASSSPVRARRSPDSRITRESRAWTRAQSRSGAWWRDTATTARAATRACASGSAVGTYLHGPLLPRNPWLADWLLERALEHANGGDASELALLPDDLEREAHVVAAARARSRGGRS